MRRPFGVTVALGIVAVAAAAAVCVPGNLFGSSSLSESAQGASPVSSQNPVGVRQITSEDLEENLKRLPAGMEFIVEYADIVSSLNEMRAAADLIVTGTVTDQRQVNPVSVISNVKVSNTFKGNSPETIEICQMGKTWESKVLTRGMEYVLFLGLQGEEEEIRFFIKGGLQGAFQNQNGELSNMDALMRKSLRELLDNAKPNSESDFETLVHWLDSNRARDTYLSLIPEFYPLDDVNQAKIFLNEHP